MSFWKKLLGVKESPKVGITGGESSKPSATAVQQTLSGGQVPKPLAPPPIASAPKAETEHSVPIRESPKANVAESKSIKLPASSIEQPTSDISTPVASAPPSITSVPTADAEPTGSIHDAAKRGDLGSVKAFIKSHANLVVSKDRESKTPLHWAALGGHKDVVELLLASKADIHSKDGQGRTPLHLASRSPKPDDPVNDILYDGLVAGTGHWDVVKLLLANGAEVNAKDDYGQSALHEAALAGRKDLAELLLANKADTNAKDDSGHTPLHYAFGSVEVVELLLQSGAEVNPKNNRGRTPLRMAEMRRQKDVVKLLLARGAKAKVVSPQPKLLRPALVLTGHSGMVNCVDVGHADGFRAVSGGEDGTIRLWNIYDGECSGVIKVGVPVKRICYCDDDITIIALCGDGVIRYYEPSGLLIAHVDGIADLRDGASDGLEPEITAFARYPGTKNVAYCARQLYDSLRVSRGGQSWSTRWNTGSIVTIKSLAINSDQGWIAAGGWRELVVWSTGRGNSADTSAPQKLMYVDGVLHEWVDPDPQYETSYGGEILALGTSWPGIVAGDNEGFITVWDFGDDGYKVRQTGEDLDEDSVNEEEFSSTNTLRLVRELDGHDSCVSCLASNDNVVLTGSYDNTLKLWDLTKGKCLSVMECPGTFGKTHPFDVSLCSGSRKRAVSAHDGVICVWDTSSAY